MVIAGNNISCNVPRIKLTSVRSSLKYSMRKITIVFLDLQVKSNFHFQIDFHLRLHFFHAKQHGWLVYKNL